MYSKVLLLNHLPFMRSRANKFRKRDIWLIYPRYLNERKGIKNCLSVLNKILKKKLLKKAKIRNADFIVSLCFAKNLTKSDLIKTKIGRFCRQEVKSTIQRYLYTALPTIYHLWNFQEHRFTHLREIAFKIKKKTSRENKKQRKRIQKETVRSSFRNGKKKQNENKMIFR